MEIGAWLDRDRGRLKAMAAHFGVTQSAISQWRTNGVPPARMKAVRTYTGGEVSLEDMLPEPARPEAPEPNAWPLQGEAAPERAHAA